MLQNTFYNFLNKIFLKIAIFSKNAKNFLKLFPNLKATSLFSFSKLMKKLKFEFFKKILKNEKNLSLTLSLIGNLSENRIGEHLLAHFIVGLFEQDHERKTLFGELFCILEVDFADQRDTLVSNPLSERNRINSEKLGSISNFQAKNWIFSLSQNFWKIII